MKKVIYILVKSGPLEGHKFLVKTDSSILIGRSEEANIRIAYDDFCSRKHALVYWEGNSCHVKDLGSTNGTSLNGSKITEAVELKNGDLIQLGNTELMVSISSCSDGKGKDGSGEVSYDD